MILTVIIMLVLAVVLLAYVLEPVLKADDEQVEIDSVIDAPHVPDFRTLLEDEEDLRDVVSEHERQPDQVSQPEPAEHRSS